VASSESLTPAHVNLRDEWLPYKHIIGQVIVDKVSSVTTVVNKLNSIHAQFRYFDMEVIAGKDDFVVSTVSRRLLAVSPGRAPACGYLAADRPPRHS
jgi:hypothetical protein